MELLENRYVLNYDIKTRLITHVKFAQGSIDTSIIEVHLLDNGNVIDITGEDIEFRFKKPDNTVVFQSMLAGVSITDAAKGIVQCILKSQTLAASGFVKCEIIRKKNGKSLVCPIFEFLVEQGIGDDGIESTNVISTFDSLMEDFNAAKVELDADLAVLAGKFTDIDNAVNSTKIIYKPSVASYSAIASTYPTPSLGWTTRCSDTGIIYRYNGSAWVEIETVQANIFDTLASRAYVDLKAAAIANGSPKGVFATLATLQADETANTTDGKKSIYLVTADGKWYYWNGSAWAVGGTYQATGLADGVVTPIKTNFFDFGQNLFNKATIDPTPSYVNNANGQLVANASYYASDYIPVLPGEPYSFVNGSGIRIAYYDANKTYISGVASPATSPVTTPANAYYMRYSFAIGLLDVQQLVHGSVTLTGQPSSFVPYGYKAIKSDEIGNNTLSGAKIIDNTLDVVKIKGTVVGKNLFNPVSRNYNKYATIANPVTNSTIADSSTYDTSDFIAVTPSTQYAFTNVRSAIEYGADKVTIKNAYDSPTVKTMGSDTAYIKISMTKANVTLTQVEQGSAATSYEEYAYKVPSYIIANKAVTSEKINDDAVLDAHLGADVLIKSSNLVVGKNLFEPDARTLSKYLDVATLTMISSANYDVSELIPVTALQAYSFTNIRSFFEYASDGTTVIAGYNYPTTHTLSETTAYIRISVAKTSLNSAQAEKGASPTAYEAYKKVIPLSLLEPFETGGTSYDQSLNTTDSVEFVSVTASSVAADAIQSTGTLPTGTLASPPNGLLSGDIWADTTDSATHPILRVKA